MIKLEIRHVATYRYEGQVSFSPHAVRLLPRPDTQVRVLRQQVDAGAGADIQMRRDLFDNLVAMCFFPHESDALDFRTEVDLTIEPKNPFHFLLESRALRVPVDYLPEERRALAAYLEPSSFQLPDWLTMEAGMFTVEGLVQINSEIPRRLAYELREKGDAMRPEETLRRGSGSCRDFAVLLAQALRKQGLAARLVSGFLWEPSEENDAPARSELHAWVEVALPGAGWVGLDPACGVFADHHRIAAAVGRQASDVAPISGRYFSNQPVASQMEAVLEIRSPGPPKPADV